MNLLQVMDILGNFVKMLFREHRIKKKKKKQKREKDPNAEVKT